MKTIFRYIIAFIIIMGGLLLFFDEIVMPMFVNQRQLVTVPHFIGLPVEEVLNHAKKTGYVIMESKIFLPNKPEGIVIDQHPKAGRIVRRGKKMRLKTSTKEQYVQMPDLIGKKMSVAELMLKQAELKTGSVSFFWPDSSFLVHHPSPNIVAEQSLPVDSSVLKYSVVHLRISEGQWAEKFVVPNLINSGIKTAEKRLKKAGLFLGRITYDIQPDFTDQTVLNQSFLAGTELAIPDSIDVTISIESRKKLLRIIEKKIN